MIEALSGIQDPYFFSTVGIPQIPDWNPEVTFLQEVNTYWPSSSESDSDSGCSMGACSDQDLSEVLADLEFSSEVDIYASSNASSIITSFMDSESDLTFSDIEISDTEEELEVSGVEVIDEIQEPDPNFQVVPGACNYNGGIHLPEPQEPELNAIRKRRTNKQPILSNFIYNSLENPAQYSSMLVWVDKSKGIFKFFSDTKEKFAAEWGRMKHNRTVMTYQKMARALRIYIKKQIVITKMKKKLHYVFREKFMAERRALETSTRS